MSDWDEHQSDIWHDLHDRLETLLSSYGAEDSSGRRDYWINHDNYGWKRITFGGNQLKMFVPELIAKIRALLTDLPDWEIVAVVDIVDKDGVWPKMGLTIRCHEIIDGLQRHLFPEPYRSFQYPDSRAGTGYD